MWLPKTVKRACSNGVKGYSTTTWTKFDPNLTPPLLQMNKSGHNPPCKNYTLLCLPALDEQFEPLRRDVAFLMLAAIIKDVPASRFLILDLRPELEFIEVVVLDIAFMIILSTLPLMIVVVVLLRFKVILLLLCLLLCCGGISNELGKCKCGV